MAVSSIKLVTISGAVSQMENVLSDCAESGFFHPDDPAAFYSEVKKYSRFSYKNPHEDNLNKIKDILLSAKIPLNKVSTAGFSPTDNEINSFTEEISMHLGLLLQKQSSVKADIEQHMKQIEETKHFTGYNLDMSRISKCEYIKANFGRLPRESYAKLNNYDDDPFIVFFPCTEDDSYYWGVYIAPIEHTDEVDRIFSGLYFEPVEVTSKDKTPEDYVSQLTSELNDLKAQEASYKNEIEDYVSKQQELALKYYRYLTELEVRCKLKSYVCCNNNIFVLVGWIPSENEKEFNALFSGRADVECDFSDGKDELKHSPPVRLKNNIFTRPFQFYVEMYGLPGYNEIDPTAFVAFTYTLLFGIMFGDLGQGIVLSIAGYLMWKLKKMPVGKILVPCGISSAFFGTLYGSVFGLEHLLDPMWHALGFEEKPIEVLESHTINNIILAAVAIGIALVIMAMFLNVYARLKRRDFGGAIFGTNGLAGIIFYSSIVTAIVCQFMLGMELLTNPVIVTLIVVSLLLMYFAEPLTKLVKGKKKWMPESWGEYCIQSFFELFETVLSYVSNTMSFLRVGAFILIHAGMMMVVTLLAGEPGTAGYIIVQVLGNAFVTVLEALLVAIQVLRLEYYEMFSRFYTGSGRAFEPVRIEKN